MSVPAQSLFIRAGYTHGLAEACQRFVGEITRLEPDAFRSAVQRLTDDTPTAESTAEALLAWAILRFTVERGADEHHSRFHRTFGGRQCLFQRRTRWSAAGFDGGSLRKLLEDWLDDYLGDFETEHCWPAAVKAAALMQSSVSKRWHVLELGRAVGGSPATVERGFSRIYGLPVQQYHLLLRARAAVGMIHSSGACVESVAAEVGYRSTKDLYRLLRDFVSLTPTGIRALNDDEYQQLLRGPVALPIPGKGQTMR